MSEVIRRLNQLEVGLERLEDPVTRESFLNVIDLLRTMQGDGFETEGVILAKQFDGASGFKVANGVVEAAGLNLADGGQLKTIMYKNDLANGTSVLLPAPNGQVWGYVGWSESVDTSSTSGNTNWYPIESGTSIDKIYLRSVSSQQNEKDKLDIRNSSGQSLQYRIIIFYRENE